MDPKQGIIIYIDKKKITVQSIDLQNKIVRLLVSNRIDSKCIFIYDIADHYDIQKNIKKHCGKIPTYPYLEINGQYWGEGKFFEEKLNEFLELSKDLVKLPTIEDSSVQNGSETKTEQEVQPEAELSIGIISSSISVIESISFGLLKNLWNSWITPEEIPKEDGEFECTVVKTNWYYRSQIRTYRFTPTSIYRFEDLENKQYRGVLYYNQITGLKKTDSKNIVIMFENKNDEQWLSGKEEDIQKIIEIVVSRAYLQPIDEDNKTCWKSSVVGVVPIATN